MVSIEKVVHGLFKEPIIGPLKSKMADLFDLDTKMQKGDFCRAMRCISAAYAVMRCLCVCLTRSWIMSKRINISSKFFHCRVAHHSSFYVSNGVAIF